MRNPKFLIIISLFVTTIAIGCGGYMLIEKVRFLDALYMTVITASTIGYGEVFPLSDVGRIFTIFLIILSVLSFSLVISFIFGKLTESAIDDILSKRTGEKKNKKIISKMNGHNIVVGCGRVGFEAVKKLLEYKEKVVVIDLNPERLAPLKELGIPFVLGSATDEVMLLKANIGEAKSLLSALPNDADNLFTVLTARKLNQDLFILSRAEKKTTTGKLLIAGADHVITPDNLGGQQMASHILSPGLVDFLDEIHISGAGANLLEIFAHKNPDTIIGKPLGEINFLDRFGSKIIGLKTKDGHYDINPPLDYVVKTDDILIVIGNTDQISKTKAEFIV